ncbi:MAG: signal peptidase II [Lachnospiraceae bacterium]|nr:signal peptidase II [Lachnospiraceae bacterium]
MKFNSKKAVWYSVLVTILIALDQLTKFIAVWKLKGNESFKIIKGVFELEYLENRGAAWGMLGGQRTMFIIVTIILVPIIIMLIMRIEKLFSNINEGKYIELDGVKFAKKLNVLQYVLVALLAGALGNFIDRLINGYVVDFLSFKLINFPIFNVADCYVTVATAILIILMLFFIKGDEFDVIFPSKKKSE